MTNGRCIIFSAPSGAGKTSIVKELLKKEDLLLEFSISACSRKPRPGEINGKDYYFLSVEQFTEKIAAGEFIEWEEVYENNFYGTLKNEITRIWQKGKHVVFDVDVKGGIQLKKKLGEAALSIFIQPPSIKELENRLKNRGTETEESLAQRMGKATEEITYAGMFDEIIINDELTKAIETSHQKIRTFIGAE